MVASAVRATPIINFLEYSLRCVQIPNSKIPSVKCHLLQQYRTLANMSLSKNKIPEPPKQPSSSFLEFFKRKRNEILKLNPGKL